MIKIEEMIEQQKDKRQKEILLKFRSSFQKDDRIRVTEHKDHYEITVSHPSTEDSTGGAEGYSLDKKTGESSMTWHEHPMDMPKVKEEKKDEVDR